MKSCYHVCISSHIEPRSLLSTPLRKHSQSIMVTLLLLLTILHGADGRFLQTRLTGNWTEAKFACSIAGGRLPLPGDDVNNSALAEHLLANNVTSTWIEAKRVITPWHINGVIIREQGCFGYDNLKLWNTEAKLIVINKLSSCAPTCTHSNSGFAGYRKQLLSNTCVCLNFTWPIERRMYSECTGANYSGFRVVKSTQSTQDPIANLRWGRQSGNRGGLCALTFLAGRSNVTNLRLEEDYCYNRHHALCCIQRDNAATVIFMPLYTWFEAHLKCTLRGGIIDSQRSKCFQWITTSTDVKERLWSGVRAWVWYINDTMTLEHRFTNWSEEQPSIESGPCVYVTWKGAWESASCKESRTIVCETDEPTSTATCPPPNSTQSSSTMIISTGDGPTTLQQREPANKSGIAAGSVVGALVVLALVGAVIWVLMRRKGKTDRGYPTRLDNPVYNKDNDDVIISKADIGPHGTTIRENSTYGWSGNNVETSAETNAADVIDGGDVASGNNTDASNDTQVYSSLEPSTKVSINEPHLYATVNLHIQRPGNYQQMQAPADQPHLCTSLTQ